MPTVFIMAFMGEAILTKKLPSLIKWREGRDRLARIAISMQIEQHDDEKRRISPRTSL